MLRPLSEEDVAGALGLSTQAGWNQTADDWLRLVRLAPDACWCVEQDRLVVSTATLVAYGDELGWLGMVLTHPSYQRRGLARSLLDQLLSHRPRTVKLDATDAGKPLYASLGFVDEAPIERWHRPPAPIEAEPCDRGPAPAGLDREAFGAKRTHWLDSFGNGFVLPNGYALSRPGKLARYLGPCVARDSSAASRLIRTTLAEHPDDPWFWDLLPGNRDAAALAAGLGFTPVRRLMRMRLGPGFNGDDALVYAIAGFELG